MVTSKAEIAGMAGVLLMVVSIPAWAAYDTWSSQRALKAAWSISGPPCPAAERPMPVGTRLRTPRTFEYGGISFTRRFGHVSCVALPERGMFNEANYRVCQFSGPAMIAVRTERGTALFEPGVGRRATVIVRDGRASCVMGGWFAA